MSKLDAEQIVNVVDALVGEIEPYGSEHIDKERRENQKTLTEVIDVLIWAVLNNTKYAGRHEHSMMVIGEEAKEFLGYLVEEYDLNDFVEKEE